MATDKCAICKHRKVKVYNEPCRSCDFNVSNYGPEVAQEDEKQ